MKNSIHVVSLVLALGLPGAAAATAAHSTHEHAAASTKQAGVTIEKRFATDAPLREGMGRIRKSVAGLGHYEQGHMGPEQAVVLAGNIETDVNFLIANCKLDPAADAALHGIIARLLQGAAALKADAKNLAAIAPMRAALAEYALTFDDPALPED